MHVLLRNYTVDSIFNLNIKSVITFANLWKIFTLTVHTTWYVVSYLGYGSISILSSEY